MAQRQFLIRNRSLAVIIACTVYGIIAYQIFDDIVGTEDVSGFISLVVKPKFSEYHFAMLDSATIKNSEQVRVRWRVQLFAEVLSTVCTCIYGGNHLQY